MKVAEIQVTQQARSQRVLAVTPDKLRSIAQQMESMIAFAKPGDVVTYEITKDLVLIHDPQKSVLDDRPLPTN